MSSSLAERVGHNESVFRRVNDRIAAGHWPATDNEPVAFRCECASLTCNILVEMTLSRYEAVRADARQFVLAPGHELPDLEEVVQREPGYVVVVKVGAAAEVAEAEDPRSA